MKKITTLFLVFGLAMSAFAQTSREEAKRVILGRGGNSNKGGTKSSDPKDIILGGDNGNQSSTYPYPNYPTDNGSRDQQIAQVNYEYDRKIQSIRNNGYLSAAEKERAIRQLEADRARRIRDIDKVYGGRRNPDKDDDNDDHEYNHEKKNRGNHYGWEKGKGNPHKNGGKEKRKKWDND